MSDFSRTPPPSTHRQAARVRLKSDTSGSRAQGGVHELVGPDRVLARLRLAERRLVDPPRHVPDEAPLLDAAAHCGDRGERLGFDLYPYTEDAIAAVRRSVLHWRFIDGIASRIDDAALREAQSRKDAVRAYELVYAALGA